MKKRTPKEKISVGYALQGMSLAEYSSGAIYAYVPIFFDTNEFEGIEKPKSQYLSIPILEIRMFSNLISI